MKSRWSLAREQKHESKQAKRDIRWENNGKVTGGTPSWGKRFDYWGVGKQRTSVSLRERRSQQWCRTEDVRTIKEGDMNTDRWRIETPPGIGNEEERAQKGVTHNKQEYNEDKLETRVTRLGEQTKWMYDRMTAEQRHSMEIRRRWR